MVKPAKRTGLAAMANDHDPTTKTSPGTIGVAKQMNIATGGGSVSKSQRPPGIYPKPSGRWFAQVRREGKNQYLGTYATIDQAVAAQSDFLRQLDRGISVDDAKSNVYTPIDTASQGAKDSSNSNSNVTSDRPYPMGIYKKPSGRWQAGIRHGGKAHHLGTFDTMEEAIAARGQAKMRFEKKDQAKAKAESSKMAKADESVGQSRKSDGGVKRPCEDIPSEDGSPPNDPCTDATSVMSDESAHNVAKSEEGGTTSSIGAKAVTDPDAHTDTFPSADTNTARRHSKRRPKRSKIDIMEEFEAKSEQCQVRRVAHAKADDAEEEEDVSTVDDEAGMMEDAASDTKSDWREAIDKSTGKPYYYNTATNEVTWDKPTSLCDAVNRKSVVHGGKPIRQVGITLRQDQGKWEARTSIGQCESKYIGMFASAEDAKTAYDIVRNALYECNLPMDDMEGRYVIFEAAKAEALEAVSDQRATVPAEPAKMEESENEDDSFDEEGIGDDGKWREALDKSSGKPYYYHVVTKEVTWEKPACFGALPLSSLNMSDDGRNQHSGASGKGHPKCIYPKPDGKWVVQVKGMYFGTFYSLEEALVARDAAFADTAEYTMKRPATNKKKFKKEKITASQNHQNHNSTWTEEEDQRLRDLVAQQQQNRKSISWSAVAKEYGSSRTSKQLRERWLNILDPTVKRGDWTEEETALVIRLQKELGNR